MQPLSQAVRLCQLCDICNLSPKLRKKSRKSRTMFPVFPRLPRSDSQRLTPQCLQIGGQRTVSRLLLIRLIQLGTICSVRGCLGRPFPRRCVSFKATSRLKKAARSIWPPVVGLMGSSVHDAETEKPMSWPAGGGDSVPAAGTRFR